MSLAVLLPELRELERQTMTAPLGLRFRDNATGAVVNEGLSVSAWAVAQPASRRTARASYSGVYHLANLPGLRAAEQGRGDDAFWQAVTTQPFMVEVVDQWERFLPFRFELAAPRRGVYAGEDLLTDSPPQQPPGIPLFSAATRGVPSALAVARATLFDPLNQRPAAWALIELQFGGRLLARSFADAQGQVTLLFPYPDLQTNPLIAPASPPLSGPSLRNQQWTLQWRARYERLPAVAPVPGALALPDGRALLAQQPAQLWADAARTQAFAGTALKFGEAVIARSRDFTHDPLRGEPLPSLLITPG
ncbi:MAG: hypothetical protein HYR56_11920 [Acidobacteria bacterium]|nr:hypothetical protein [Acidobacteriota bacterium]MBI3428089.1 hypothetical protein [Acidobacteriota bacterium]